MKREILFRGKRIDNGEWVYGCYYFLNGETFIIPYDKFAGDEPISEALSDYCVIPETVGQFTGLTDKNGNKIFEGDIINQNGKVNNGSSGCKVVSHKRIAKCDVSSSGTNMYLSNYRSDIHSSTIEVIGNIHDNTELLK